jgi:hypothetical protein
MYTHVEINGPISVNHEGSLVIPTVIEGVDVRLVESNSFAGQVDITEIFLPETIEFVGSEAFADCMNAVFNPSGVCPMCFVPPQVPHEEGCALADINEVILAMNRPISIYGIWMRHIGIGAFRNCVNLESVILGEYISHVDDHAFEGCVNLEQIIILREQAPLIQPTAFLGTNPDLKIFVPEEAVGYDAPEWEPYDVQYILKP